jgi:hypothetical protein
MVESSGLSGLAEPRTFIARYVGMPGSLADPRRAELDKMLADLEPRRELAYRLALIALSEHCRGDAGWKRRVLELEKPLGRGARTEVLREAERIMGDLVRSAS